MNQRDRGLEHWRARLLEVRLPVLSDPESAEWLLDPASDLQTLSQVLDADLPLAVDVILAAASQPRLRGEVQGLQHALNVLGSTRVQTVLAPRMADTLDPSDPAHRLCLQALSTSRLAVHLLWTWTRLINPTAYDEYLDWLTLMLGLARWKLPLVAPDIAAEIEARTRQGERRSVVERQLLGCGLDELNRLHLQDIGLPEDAPLNHQPRLDARLLAHAGKLAWRSGMAPEIPAWIARPLRQRTSVSMLAHLLAWSIHDGWHSGHTDRLLAVASARSNLPLDQIVSASRQAALRASRASAFAGKVSAPAAQLLWPAPPPRSLRRASPNAAAGSAAAPRNTTRTSAEAGGLPLHAAHEPNADIVEVFNQNCLHGRHADLREFITATGTTLEQGLGLARFMLFLKATNADRLGCYFAYGFRPALEARKISVAANDENLLARLFRHTSGALWVRAEQMQAGQRQLPPEIRDHALPSGLLLGAVHLKARPVGVIWADSGDAGAPLSEAHYVEFKHMIGNFGAEFSRLTSAMKNQASKP